jgi:hypothetical protein
MARGKKKEAEKRRYRKKPKESWGIYVYKVLK